MVSIFRRILFVFIIPSGTDEIANEVEIKISLDVPLSNNNKRPTGANLNIEDDETYFSPSKTFQAASVSPHYKWSLSDKMKYYELKQFHAYNSDHDLDDNILTRSPAPQNFPGPAP